MWSKLDDVAMQVVTFDHMTTGRAAAEGRVFRNQMVHLLSLLSALMVQDLHAKEDLDQLTGTRPRIRLPGGPDTVMEVLLSPHILPHLVPYLDHISLHSSSHIAFHIASHTSPHICP